MDLSKVFALLAIATLFSCGKVNNKCIVKGQLSGGDGDVVIYPYQEVKSKAEADRLSYKAKIVDGKFELELDSEKAFRTMNIRMGKILKQYSIFSEPGILNISEKEGKLIGKGSILNDEYHQLLIKLNYEAYDKLKYNKRPNIKEKEIIENYDLKLWELSKEYPKSLPLTRLFYQKYWSADAATLNEIIHVFSKDIRQSYYLKKMVIRRDNLERVAIGKQAPIFSLKSLDGKEIAVDMYKGKYLLVDFWASWCGPCRAEIPNLKEIYNDYESKGLEILSVSTDADEKAWLKAVAKEQMPWPQVRDTKSISDSYNITAIPAIFLIDLSGKIIDKGLHGQNLRDKIEETLK